MEKKGAIANRYRPRLVKRKLAHFISVFRGKNLA
jgi:hypothetical protein